MGAQTRRTANVVWHEEIGKFFQSQRKDEVVPGIASHIKKFWDPRMRNAVFAHIEQGGDGLDPLVKEALLHLRENKEP